MNNYRIEIVTSIDSDIFYQLENLIKEFAINVYNIQKFNLFNKPYIEKQKVIYQYKEKLTENELIELDRDIKNRIMFLKQSIENKQLDKETRYYVCVVNGKVEAFQTAQVRKNGDSVEGWRNFAYTKQEYSGPITIKDKSGCEKKVNITNELYDAITEWFHEEGVKIEKTATGKNMLKNILAYIVYKGFVPSYQDDQRIYFIKDYENPRSKEELKGIYKRTISDLKRTV